MLLANLLNQIQKTLNLSIDNIYLWSDSTITLQWINTSPHLLNTFVANRVSQIRSLTNPSNWMYVATKQNPADFISRGQMPHEFVQNNLWKSGPDWLTTNEVQWPSQIFEKPACPELKRNVVLLNLPPDRGGISRFLSAISNLNKMKRVMAYCMRFINKLKQKCQVKKNLNGISNHVTIDSEMQSELKNPSKESIKTNETESSEHFSIDELNISMSKILIALQKSCFDREIKVLQGESKLARSSDLHSLTPFLDKKGLLRVGGRLQNSVLKYNETFPIILPKAHHLTELIVRTEHLNNFHCGTQATLYAVRSNYWPINGIKTVKTVLSKCIKCFRANPKDCSYSMGNLPKDRVTESRPFSTTGIDYCGPFFIKEKKERNRNKVKAYVAIFVCFATKACHIE